MRYGLAPSKYRVNTSKHSHDDLLTLCKEKQKEDRAPTHSKSSDSKFDDISIQQSITFLSFF